MTDKLRAAAQAALKALELAQTDIEWQLNSPTRRVLRKAEIALRAALSEPSTTNKGLMMDNQVTVLPDGSAFATASYPLPKDHWLYALRGEWDSRRDDFAETPHPILTNAQRQAVTVAARYAVCGATMCGKEMDFDPDALVQNLCYALCGPANGAALSEPQTPVSLDAGKSTAAVVSGSTPEPVWIQPNHLQKAKATPFMCRVEPTQRMKDFVPLYASPPAQKFVCSTGLCHYRRPLSDEQIYNLDPCPHVMFDSQRIAFARAIEAAHGIGAGKTKPTLMCPQCGVDRLEDACPTPGQCPVIGGAA